MTYREQFESAMACNTPEEAKVWLDAEVARCSRELGQTPEHARTVILANLGYIAGYYDHSTAQKVHRLFGAVHPIFGSANYHKTVTAEQAFGAGLKFAEEHPNAE